MFSPFIWQLWRRRMQHIWAIKPRNSIPFHSSKRLNWFSSEGRRKYLEKVSEVGLQTVSQLRYTASWNLPWRPKNPSIENCYRSPEKSVYAYVILPCISLKWSHKKLQQVAQRIGVKTGYRFRVRTQFIHKPSEPYQSHSSFASCILHPPRWDKVVRCEDTSWQSLAEATVRAATQHSVNKTARSPKTLPSVCRDG